MVEAASFLDNAVLPDVPCTIDGQLPEDLSHCRCHRTRPLWNCSMLTFPWALEGVALNVATFLVSSVRRQLYAHATASTSPSISDIPCSAWSCFLTPKVTLLS